MSLVAGLRCATRERGPFGLHPYKCKPVRAAAPRLWLSPALLAPSSIPYSSPYLLKPLVSHRFLFHTLLAPCEVLRRRAKVTVPASLQAGHKHLNTTLQNPSGSLNSSLHGHSSAGPSM